jgi:hypothetical protein
MITYDPERKIIRTCTAPFEFVNDAGELEVRDITVEYYSISTKKLKELREASAKRLKDDPDQPQWFSELLFERLHALPDLVDKKKKPYKITVDFLDTFDLKNLEAIRQAIEEDGRPKAPPEK